MDSWTSIQVEHVAHYRRYISRYRQHEEGRRFNGRGRTKYEASGVCGQSPDGAGRVDVGLHVPEIHQCHS